MDLPTTLWSADQRALPHVPAMHAYVPGAQPTTTGWTKLNTNELPYPPSPRIAPAIMAEMERLPLYPNPTAAPLRKAIAQRHGLDDAQVIVGNGSDDVLNLLARVFVGKGRAAAMTLPSYSLYPVLGDIQGVPVQQIPFTRIMELPVREIAQCGANLFYLTAPNAPTGVQFDLATIHTAASVFRGIFVIDEAYVDFAEHDSTSLLHALPNIVITRTFSKSYGLAGLRVGYGLASPEIVGLLDRVRDSYNVNRLSQAGALAAVQDRDYYRPIIARMKQTRDALAESFRSRGFFTYPSQANFVFTEPVDAEGRGGAEVARSLFNHLLDNKVLVRHFGGNALTESFLRISVGTPQQMETLLGHIDAWRNHA